MKTKKKDTVKKQFVFFGAIFAKNKKGLSPVIGVGLLLVMVLAVLVNFYFWVGSYQETVEVKSEVRNTQESRENLIEIKDLKGGYLFINNDLGEKTTLKKVKLGQVECDFGDYYLLEGMNIINVKECIDNKVDYKEDILLVFEEFTVDKFSYVKPGNTNLDNYNVDFDTFQKINEDEGGFNVSLFNFDSFGNSIAELGDLDKDEVEDIIIGTYPDDENGTNTGAIYVIFLEEDGMVKSHQKISNAYGNLGVVLGNNDQFGFTVANVGDLDKDGIIDIVVGAIGDDDGGQNSGAVYILFMNQDGTVKSTQKISELEGNLGNILSNQDKFASVGKIGDLNGDGNVDIAVGAHDRDGSKGAVFILFLNSNGTVNANHEINDATYSFGLDSNDFFGYDVAGIGDLDKDGNYDIVVSAYGDDDLGADMGAFYVLFLNSNGSVKNHIKYPNTVEYNVSQSFALSVGGPGDINGDWIPDILIGNDYDANGGGNKGSIMIMYMARDGSVIDFQKITTNDDIFNATETQDNFFGSAVVGAGDLDNNNKKEIVIGANRDNGKGQNRGAIYVLFGN